MTVLSGSGRVLLVDDEPRVLDFVSRALRSEGYEVDTVERGEEGYRLAVSNNYDVIVLDLLMPGTGGASVLGRVLRRKPDQPVIVLSCLSDTASKVECLELGADDYITKPFALDELLARLKARMRDRARQEPATRLVTRGLTLDLVRRQVDWGADPVDLSQRECILLAELMRNAGTAVSRERLLSAVWGYSFDPHSNVVEVYVRRLRSKLPPGTVGTIRGRGYGVGLG